MLKKLQHPSPKKIKLAKKVFENYSRTGNIRDTAEQMKLSYDTVIKYIMLVDDLNLKDKILDKKIYYGKDIDNSKDTKELPPAVINTYFNTDNNYCQEKFINTNNNLVLDEEISTEIVEDGDDGILANKVPDIKDTKNRILASKLDTIAFKYLGYLDNPSEQQLHRTSLKDRAIIAGILLDKKSQLVSKAADSVKNQSIIFNLFGDNKNLAQFITGNMQRQKALADRPVKKYREA